ncbi:MAG: Diaminopimelate decarboxylase [Rhizobium sp.]|nr:Diaminopimelate decarboxylase [Rhizobium sp.]
MSKNAHWVIPGHVEARDGRLLFAGHDAAALLAAHGSPLYLLSAKRIIDTVQRFKATAAAAPLPVTICYASKACSAIAVLKLLNDEAISIEVNSAGELFRAKTAGFPPDRIIFNGVAKSAEELLSALDPPIKAINIDSIFELKRLVSIARGVGKVARISLRIVPNVQSSTSAGNQTGAESTKFGILLRELPEAMTLLRDSADCLVLVGIHAHVGSQIGSVAPYQKAAQMLVSVKAEVEAAFGVELEHLNIGGGFPIPYMRGANETPQDDIFAPAIDMDGVVQDVVASLAKALPGKTEIIVEPGRSLVGDAGILLSTVENIKERLSEPWLVLDAGYNVLVESYTYKWYYHALSATKLNEDEKPFRVAGPLCDNGDAFFDVEGETTVRKLIEAEPTLEANRALLESTLIRMPPTRSLAASTGPGDCIAFLDCGAYVLDQMTPNNSRQRPECGLIDLEGNYRTLRGRDSLEDLLFKEVL